MKFVPLCLATLMLVGCGGSSTTVKNSRIRVYNGMAATTVDVQAEVGDLASALAPDNQTSYGTINVSAIREVVLQKSGTTNALATLLTTFAEDRIYTVIPFGFEGGTGDQTPDILILTDNDSAPAANTYRLRIVNLAPNAAPFDVYITTPTGSLTGSPTFANVGFGSSTSSQTLPSGNLRLRVRQAGTSNPVQWDLNPFNTVGGEAYTLVFTNATSAPTLRGRFLAER